MILRIFIYQIESLCLKIIKILFMDLYKEINEKKGYAICNVENLKAFKKIENLSLKKLTFQVLIKKI